MPDDEKDCSLWSSAILFLALSNTSCAAFFFGQHR
ncbi:hypothetical protein predicted by Glimmer/Critica [Acetobacter ghanensis]|uniref:Uncharacterized protein n=1 Tax=Acetobacter ghanensis TaxID=431306 RepID=A0A0U5F5K0_9PROT|nr:hypothetical protein predicted by Glimmer/Critica [Acetobacter ghanensis]